MAQRHTAHSTGHELVAPPTCQVLGSRQRTDLRWAKQRNNGQDLAYLSQGEFAEAEKGQGKGWEVQEEACVDVKAKFYSYGGLGGS